MSRYEREKFKKQETARLKFEEAVLRNNDDILAIHRRDHFHCQFPGCMNNSNQLAHRIAKTKGNGYEVQAIVWNRYKVDIDPKLILNHPLNVVACCRANGHNDSFNIGNNTVKKNNLLEKIFDDLEKEGVLCRCPEESTEIM